MRSYASLLSVALPLEAAIARGREGEGGSVLALSVTPTPVASPPPPPPPAVQRGTKKAAMKQFYASLLFSLESGQRDDLIMCVHVHTCTSEYPVHSSSPIHFCHSRQSGRSTDILQTKKH